MCRPTQGIQRELCWGTGIINELNLLRPIYGKSTNYGHFGKSDPDLTWERTDKVAVLQKAAK
jgi:S-adenosylmethionine synthetase